MGNLRNAGYEYPAPSRFAELNDPTSEVDRLIAKSVEKEKAAHIKRMKAATFVPDWRRRFIEE